jgi:hypothetical protein
MERLRAEADSLRAAVAQQDTLYILQRDTVDRVVVRTRTVTDSVLVTTPVVTLVPPVSPSGENVVFGDSLECFRFGAIQQWRDSLQAAITAEREAANLAIVTRDAHITTLRTTITAYQTRLDAAIAAARPSHGWRMDALLVGVGFAFGVLVR